MTKTRPGLCDRHLQAIEAECIRLGLESLIEEDTDTYNHKAAEIVLSGGENITVDNYEPMAVARLAIYMNAMNIMDGDPQDVAAFLGKHCPICVLNHLHWQEYPEEGSHAIDHWTDKAARSARDAWVELFK